MNEPKTAQEVKLLDSLSIATTPTPQNELLGLPSSNGLSLLCETIGRGYKEVFLVGEKRKGFSHAREYDTVANTEEGTLTVASKSKKDTINLVVNMGAAIDRALKALDEPLSKNEEMQFRQKVVKTKTAIYERSPARQLFYFILIEGNRQAFSNGKLINRHIYFPLQKLVDMKLYKDLKQARKAFKAGIDQLTDIQIVFSEKGKDVDLYTKKNLFNGGTVYNGQCEVEFGSDILWSFLLNYYMFVPSYFFSLTPREQDLLHFIFSQIRKNIKECCKNGYINISFRAAAYILNLNLDCKSAKINFRRDLLTDGILKAIHAINTQEEQHDKNLFIEPLYNSQETLKGCLEHGFLKASFTGFYANALQAAQKTLSNTEQKAIQRKQKIVDKAKVKNLAESMKAEAEAKAAAAAATAAATATATV